MYEQFIEEAASKIVVEPELSVRRAIARRNVGHMCAAGQIPSSKAWAIMYEGLRVRGLDIYRAS